MIAPTPNLVTDAAARQRERERMLASPTGLKRPVLALAGWRAPIMSTAMLVRRLVALTGAGEEQIRPMAYPLSTDLDGIVQRVVERAMEWFPAADGRGTAEIDVVAVSMGGLIARAAASPATARRLGSRLRIARLFTLATPHRGAKLTRYIIPDRAARHMCAGSPFLCRLDEALACAEYELVCYTRLGDWWVGARNTAPAGVNPIWFPAVPYGSHITIAHEPRITLDLARRLRGEEPLFVPKGPPPRD